ncbi:MAG: hypothetical protein EAZ91_00400 [Cytophagales bacterium]|nr:MAG: hypothetical protein EAZ91_00400 [Cytophagales bacterium]
MHKTVPLILLPDFSEAACDAVVTSLAILLPEAVLLPMHMGNMSLADYEHSLRGLANNPPGQLILTLSSVDPTDFVSEATRRVCQKLFPGFGTLIRQAALPTNPAALLWDNTAGLCGQTLIVNLPSDANVIRTSLPLLFPAIPNAIRLAS